MSQSRWWSQPFAPEGSAAAEGIARQLGRPDLDDLTILVREAAQNSWDARLACGTPSFQIEIRELGPESVKWQQEFLPPPHEESVAHLEHVLQPDTKIIVVSDRGTAGLCGPIRAGVRAKPGEGNHFVQFLRNVGEPRDQALGGGTYGFGKGIFYKLSASGTILVDSRTNSGDVRSRRLMGASLGSSYYDDDDRRFTGRHWWGTVGTDDVPDPLQGEEAEATAAALGLPGFVNDETGTDIVILGADLGFIEEADGPRPRTPEEAGMYIGSSILWNLWPKFVGLSSKDRMTFRVRIDGVDLPLPDPSNVDDFAPFVESLLAIQEGNAMPYGRRTEPKQAGQLAIAQGAADVGVVLPVVNAAKPFSGPAHHIARMRQAELVVDYLETQAHPNALLRYGGVFRASAEADEFFASAEPPTHDDWVERGLVGNTKTVVTGARQFIKRRVESKFAGSPTAVGQGASGLGALAARLGGLVPRQSPGTSLTDTPVAVRSAPRSSRSRGPVILEGPGLLIRNGSPFVVARVRFFESADTQTFRAEVAVVLDGGSSETSAPSGELGPKVLQWLSVRGGDPVFGPVVIVPPGPDSEWWVYASYVPDAVLRMKVQREKADA